MVSTPRNTIRMTALAVALGSVWLISGCSSTRGLPPAPTSTEKSAEHVYQIGALDEVSVVVWRNPDLSSTVTVRPDGRLSLPLAENIVAAGKRPEELSREIESALAKYIRDPVVTVLVTRAQGEASRQVRIIGEAARPQAVAYRQNMSLLDVMIQVGGLTDFADGNSAVLVRGSEGGKQYAVRLKDLVRRGDISANVEMQPGDILIIPQSWF
ncbi:MAG: sugar ABC transporter substrate-binding protein [Burkholderiales bacterium RIFCSPHIGHO2_01_FULL_63_240]|jgi:polysaccharide biosynthesis/export protein|nr:MAG: sugar ABC transporter substrate-binding protein [Burkholderiales bacterium RIFCSPHIGHO2_01_FULL_63_240]